MKIMTMYAINSDRLYGGAYKRYMELINGFLGKDHEVNHISPKGFLNISHENFHHYGFNKIPLIPTYLSFVLQAVPLSLSIGLRKDVDCIVTFAVFDTLVGIIYKLFFRKTKIIYCDRGDSLRGMIIDMEENNKMGFYNNLKINVLSGLEKIISERIDLNIFNSDIRKININEKYKLKSSVTIYNNSNPSWVSEKVLKSHEKSIKLREKYAGKKILCYIGNLFIHGKDLNTLLIAFKKIKKSFNEVVLILVGDGPDKAKIIENIKHNNLSDNIIVEGWQSNPFPYMLSSDITIITTLHEGCSNSILESIYCSDVVLGSNVSGVVDLLKYDELLFTPKNPDELSEKVLGLLEHDHIYSQAVNLVKERKKIFIFDWDSKMVETIQEFVKNPEKSGD